MTIPVTGATGLVGSNVVTQLVAQGKKVRTIVRNPAAADAEALRKAGVETVTGEISKMRDVTAAVKGTTGIIHSAAMLGRPGSSMMEGFYANALGTIHIYSAAAAEGGIPTVHVITNTYFDSTKTQTETSPIDLLFRNSDAYTTTKRLGYVEGLARVLEGQDIRFMQPGAVYGPSICVEKALLKTSFNGRFAAAIRGELAAQIPLGASFAYAPDCGEVCIAALERGTKGERYMALGVKSEVRTLAGFLNWACEMAGVEHRISEIPRDELDSPEIIEKYGETIPHLAKRKQPEPLFDSSFTETRLGVTPTSFEVGMPETITWMREQGVI